MDGFALVAIAVGLSLGLWVTTVAAVAYVLWAWVYKPWKVMRTDIAAAGQAASAAVQAVQQARVMTMTDEEVSLRERQMQARQSARRTAGGGGP